MLFELLPHFARLMPMADKYLSTHSASEKAQEAALAALALDIRAEVSKGTAAQAGVLRQLQDQSVQIGDLALDLTRTRIGLEGVEARVAKVEKSMESVAASSVQSAKLLRAIVALAALSLGLLLVLAVHVLVRSSH